MSTGHDRKQGAFAVLPAPLPRRLVEEGLCSSGLGWPEGLWDLSLAEETTSQRHRRQAAAIRICEDCPVRQLCAEYASTEQQSGIWGGQVFHAA